MTSIEYANNVLAYLQNVEDTGDAIEFVRIYLGAIENATEHTGQGQVNRQEILRHISEVDNRIVAT